MRRRRTSRSATTDAVTATALMAAACSASEDGVSSGTTDTVAGTIDATGDPATPYEWAVELADFLDTGVLYTVEGEATCTDDSDVDVFVPVGESEIDQIIALFDCLRENGLDVPEIGLDDIIADPLGETFGDAIDPADPEFGAAATACQDLLL